ncbi:hypothetical protein AB3S75_043321 [Citrus x aurantiifolia]
MKKMAGNRAMEPVRFFRVILPSILEQKKLKIPKAFVRRFGYEELSSDATLKTPNGCVWQVGVTKDKEKIWLDDGWHDFVKDHSICVAYFLVFKYAKNSTFDVLIFDMTACEIDYPYHRVQPNKEEQNSIHDDEMQCENSTKKLGSRASCKNQMHHSQGSLHRKRLLNGTAGNFSGPSSAVQDDHQTEFVDGQALSALLEEMGISISRSCLSLEAEERQRVITAARLFEPRNPSFMVIVRGNERRKACLFIPIKFVNNYLCKVPKFIKVQASDGREWPIQTRYSHTGALYLSGGWPGFVVDMNLDRGDICIFELIKMDDVIMKVSVFSASKECDYSLTICA